MILNRVWAGNEIYILLAVYALLASACAYGGVAYAKKAIKRTFIPIRAARSDEAALLSDLALRSKAHWGYSAEFLDQCTTELTHQSAQIENERFDFAVAERNGGVAGFYALKRTSESAFELEALFVEPEHIGMGVGRHLIQHALNTIATKSGTLLQIQGDPNAERFYLAAGAKLVGSRESGSVPGRFLPLYEITV